MVLCSTCWIVELLEDMLGRKGIPFNFLLLCIPVNTLTSPPSDVTTIIQVTKVLTRSATAPTVATAADQSSPTVDILSSASSTVERTVATIPTHPHVTTSGDQTNTVIQSTNRASATVEGTVATLSTPSYMAEHQYTSIIQGTNTVSTQTERNMAPISTNQNVNSPPSVTMEGYATLMTYDTKSPTAPLVSQSEGTRASITNAAGEPVTTPAPQEVATESLEDSRKGKVHHKAKHLTEGNIPISSCARKSSGYFFTKQNICRCIHYLHPSLKQHAIQVLDIYPFLAKHFSGRRRFGMFLDENK